MLILLLSGALAAPAVAQEDERFYGRWEPGSTTAGGSILFIERSGYLSNQSADGQHWFVQKYKVIKDFGDRVIIHAWDLSLPEGDFNRDSLIVLILDREGIYRGRKYSTLNTQHCGGGDERDCFFKDQDPDAIWRRVMEWTARASEGFPYDRCGLTLQGETGEGWGSVGWFRYVDP